MRRQNGQSAHPPTYSEEQVARRLGPRTIDKARGYVRAVSDIGWADDILRAHVPGTQPAPYVVEISFINNPPIGYCSCPVGYACKHVAATLLAYLERKESAARAGVGMEVEQWLSSFRTKVESTQLARANAAKPATGAVYRIVHVLAPALLAQSAFGLLTFKARLGVDGAIRSTESWTPNYAAWNSPPTFVTSEDDASIRALRSERGYSGNTHAL
ncbi:SWIM zinc finger family protein [Caballeronia sp. INDeC2]|uniref:SWIM zinc finger family protein n=1 Tax=Caballeronia sp. INDeC2 TaxID=2921747 RepID=UPI002028D421|nr:SWIM zinc finger family protein [Caballeronia sp. INDeC2]